MPAQPSTTSADDHEPNGTQLQPRRRGIYLLPNLFTTGAMFCGFFAMVSAISGKYQEAAAAVFLATILDGLDGRVARLTNTQSDFGKEYDSLSDLVSFGLAPAIIVFVWAGDATPVIRWLPLSWLITFFFLACAALRLARFNTQVGHVDPKYFIGLPSPTAAVLVTAFVWTADSYQWSAEALAWPILLVTTAAGALMVSNVRFPSGKGLNWQGGVPFRYIIAVVLLFILIALEPALVLWMAASIYTSVGVIRNVLRRKRASGT